MGACGGVLPASVGLAQALGRGGELLTDTPERALRMVVLGPGPIAAAGPAVAAAVQTAGTQRPSTVR
ncbi:hypothetical protein Sgou_12240 [Streptomyces gougerotii]|uniref:Glycerate kinase n=3 Tax=Streptomyces TaxID=1883 RepID=A0A8H9LP30_9ACTN|nr:hypothetical protein [Streptomyces sp. DSM 41037]SUP38326.1 Glycerate kinase [Streptomyces griseus]GFH71445.1 hypothetical protein Sdia_22130 [Streptomyces diastaticus subsp. diastaticus]GFH76554.1 hypothetical protein Sgou_12240 [Streptomyces gougerotii]GGU12406.1 hypothetical protein GCM10015534_13690 [Streptomyces diastaticus subsp. diastaticus]